MTMLSITIIGVLVIFIALLSLGIIMRFIANAVMMFIAFILLAAGLVYLGIDELLNHLH